MIGRACPERIFAARETRCLRCKKPSAPRKLSLGTGGIEVQGPLEATQNERFNDALALKSQARR